MWQDINPGVIGIKGYDYEAHGAAYNLMFEQPSFELGVREIVMYNPRNEHAMTSHRLDRLDWKYHWFD